MNLTLGSLCDGSGGFPLAGMNNGIRPVWSAEVEPFPIAVTRARLPFVKHYGDVNALNGADLEPVDIITAGSPCFPAGTLVLTDKGLIEIEKIKVGDMVLTHKGRWKKVTKVGRKEASTIRLKGNHYGLECTPNHPIFSFDGANISWTAAEDMKNKLWCVPTTFEYLPAPHPVNYNNKCIKPLPKFSRNFFYFVGRWLGDGWVRDGQRPDRPRGQRFATIFLCDSNDKLNDLISTVKCVSDKYSIEKCGSSVKVKCNGRALCDFLTDNFGKCAHEKKIPAWTLSLPAEYRKALLQGILDSNGNRRSKLYRVTTVSKKLAFGIRLLAESLGRETSVYYSKRPAEYIIQGRKVHQRCSYTTEIMDGKTHYDDGSHRWYKVKRIDNASVTTTVYNMTVEDDNSYTADGIVVHNCQDMSIAGKRAGIIEGERSSLFFQCIRIIKEMRENDKRNGRTGKDVRPRFAIWENVPGAFSSNGGGDFRCVLESYANIQGTDVSVPQPKKWEPSGCIVGDGWSVAWRTLDAQYWGVPQRRKRIYLVADFASECAGKILFESESLLGYSPKGGTAGQNPSGNFEECSGISNLCLNDQGGERMDVTEGMTSTLRAESHHPPIVMEPAYCLQGNGIDRADTAGCNGCGWRDKASFTLNTVDRHAVAYPVENHPADSRVTLGDDGIVQTLTSKMGTGGGNTPIVLMKS